MQFQCVVILYYLKLDAREKATTPLANKDTWERQPRGWIFLHRDDIAMRTITFVAYYNTTTCLFTTENITTRQCVRKSANHCIYNQQVTGHMLT